MAPKLLLQHPTVVAGCQPQPQVQLPQSSEVMEVANHLNADAADLARKQLCTAPKNVRYRTLLSTSSLLANAP